jgi:uncharacterized protein (TIGR02996 family)
LPAPPSPLHPELLALLSACRAAPADDTPRLVLADWLDENADAAGLPGPGDARARAALVRAQVELARPTYDTARLLLLRAEESRLLAANATRWLGNLPRRLHELRHRPFGFAARAPAAGRAFDFDPLAPGHPWRFTRGLLTVGLDVKELDDPQVGAWFAAPPAAWVEEAGVDLDVPALERLAVPDALRPYLGVRCSVGTGPARSMRLAGARPEPPSPRRLRRILRGANFALVRSLALFASAVEAGVMAMLPGANVVGLRRLAVVAPVGDPGAAFLAAAPLANLSALDVSGCAVGAGGLRLLANSPHLRHLVSLTAYRNPFGCDGVAALAASPLAERLNALDLQNTGAGDRGVSALAASRLLGRLASPGLNLSMNPVGDGGAAALAACPHLEAFAELVLRDCRVGDAGAAALAGSPHAAHLACLDLWGNRVGDRGARALAASPHLAGVRDLSLRDNRITAAGATALRKRFGGWVKV